MAEIGMDFPMTRSARKAKLKDIVKNENPISTVKVPGHGSKNVYRIPLDFLSYNPYNTRFLAQAKTLETRIGRELSDERAEDVKEIEAFIWNYKQEKNASTIMSLIKEGQLQPGVVTSSGVILSGNRRFRLLNEIQRNGKTYLKPGVNLDGLQYFEAAILDNELTDKDIRKYESFYQYGNEDKIEYDPIQKYIAASVQKDLGYDEKEIADNFLTLTGGDEKVIKEWLNIFDLMKEYLEYIDERGIYTALETREESFRNLNNTLNSLTKRNSGKNIWAFDDIDIEDLKIRYFDYIYLNKSTHDFRILKKVFSDQNRWREFNSDVEKCVNSVDLPSMEEYREKYVDEDESQIAKIRENDYKVACGNELNQRFMYEKADVDNKEIEETPLKLVDQIDGKITKIEMAISSSTDDGVVYTDEFLQKIKSLISRLGHIKQRLD